VQVCSNRCKAAGVKSGRGQVVRRCGRNRGRKTVCRQVTGRNPGRAGRQGRWCVKAGGRAGRQAGSELQGTRNGRHSPRAGRQRAAVQAGRTCR